MSRTVTAGTTGFFKAVEGVRDRWMQRASSVPPAANVSTSASSSLVDVSKSDAASTSGNVSLASSPETSPKPPASKMRPLSLVAASRSLDSSPQPPPQPAPAAEARSSFGGWGGISSFFSQRAASRVSVSQPAATTAPPRDASPAPSVSTTKSRVASYTPPFTPPADLGLDELHPKNLDEVYGTAPAVVTLPLQASLTNKDTHAQAPTQAPRRSTSTLGSVGRIDEDGEHEYEGTGFAL